MADYNKDIQDREREKQERIKEVEARKKRTMNYNNSVKIGESTKHSYNVVIDDEQFLQIAKMKRLIQLHHYWMVIKLKNFHSKIKKKLIKLYLK